MQVLLEENDGKEPVLNITKFNSLGYQYLKYLGEPYFDCELCGNIIKRKPGDKHHQKYCDRCATIIHAKQMADAVKRARSRK